MDLLGTAHNALWKYQFDPLPEEQRNQVKEHLIKAGMSEEEAKAYTDTMHLIRPGRTYGASHVEDLVDLVDRALGSGNRRIVLEVELETPEDHHVSITVKELGQASWEEL